MLSCSACLVSALAVQMLNVAVGWWVYALIRDPIALGLAGLAVFLPAIDLANSHAANRFDRLLILRIRNAIATLAAGRTDLCAAPAIWRHPRLR